MVLDPSKPDYYLDTLRTQLPAPIPHIALLASDYFECGQNVGARGLDFDLTFCRHYMVIHLSTKWIGTHERRNLHFGPPAK